MTMLVEAVAGWLVANVLFVVWMTSLSRRGERRRAGTRAMAHRLDNGERVLETRATGQDQAAA